MANGGPDTNKSQVRDAPSKLRSSVPVPFLPLCLPVQTISPPLVLLASPSPLAIARSTSGKETQV